MSIPSYWREMPQRYRYEAVRCSGCKKVYFPPRLICPVCKSRKFETTKLPEIGEVLTYTIIRVPPKPFTDGAPYAVGVIELEGGIKVMAQIADCAPEDIKIGMKVRVEFRKIREEGEAGIICYGYKYVPV